jgi:hypothetical protein
MKSKFAPIVMIILAIFVVTVLVSPATAVGSLTGKVAYTNNKILNNTTVSLVNGSNVSEYIPGFNTTADEQGYFQFLNVPLGFYKVFAWSPYYADGYSAGINMTSNDTYFAGVVLQAIPYFADIRASPISLTYGGTSDISATIYDYWGNRIGPGWQIIFNSTVGQMVPNSTVTDQNGNVYSHIGYVENASYAEIWVNATSTNGTLYELLAKVSAVDITPTPSVVPSASAIPTASPTVVPNATATPTATIAPTPTLASTPTPGFGLLAAMAAIGTALAVCRRKRT